MMICNDSLVLKLPSYLLLSRVLLYLVLIQTNTTATTPNKSDNPIRLEAAARTDVMKTTALVVLKVPAPLLALALDRAALARTTILIQIRLANRANHNTIVPSRSA
jgi:hypothetical protein